jgi:membrane protease YdiL (CAAX protease family)
MSSLQFFLFVFFYASISEELLFRGFSQNFFRPLNTIQLNIGKNVYISLTVVLSGASFGLGHLILLSTKTSGSIIFRIEIITWIGGIIAGYFQEKHQNILPAIVVHITLNLPDLIIRFIM